MGWEAVIRSRPLVGGGCHIRIGGRFAPSRSHLEEVVALYDPASHGLLTHQTLTYPQVTAQAYLWIVLLCLGYSDQAMALSDAAIAEARALAHAPTLVSGLALGIVALWVVGDEFAAV